MDKRGEKALNLRDESAGDKIVFKDIKEFKPTFWYVTFLCFTFYAAIFPFQSLSTDFFHTKWGIARTADVRRAASWPRSSTTSSTSSARPAASRASSSSPR